MTDASVKNQSVEQATFMETSYDFDLLINARNRATTPPNISIIASAADTEKITKEDYVDALRSLRTQLTRIIKEREREINNGDSQIKPN